MGRPLEIGDFIEVPAWHTWGQVVAILPQSPLGSAASVTVRLEERRPEGPTNTYRLEPDEFIFMD